ncbi:MAG: hypothetical protein ABS35_03105 [Kaistia sp. SCN 65-12]|nr:MAG: hypothetical protein ABS35_03105 [Kaistia sp. SCN 65-12]
MREAVVAYHRELKCDVLSLTYDFTTHVGTLKMGDGNDCDLAKCFGVFNRIDPGVCLIKTFAGSAFVATHQILKG